MEYATTAATAVGFLISSGNALIALIMTLKNAKPEIEERLTRIKSHWYQIQEQLEFLQRTWTLLCEDHQENQLRILAQLQNKVQGAERRVKGLLRKRDKAERTINENLRVRRFRYLFVKPYLDAVINDLTAWQPMYDTSWFLIMKIASPIIDEELKKKTEVTSSVGSSKATRLMRAASKLREAAVGEENPKVHISLPQEGLEGAQKSRIPYSGVTLVTRQDSSSTHIVDSIPCPAYSYVGLSEQDVRRLASKLHAVDPAIFGVLRCRGFIKMRSSSGSKVTSFEMVFETPSTQSPHSLRSCLISDQNQSLTERIHLAKRLATSVSYVHTLDFVHKNICPENIIGFSNIDQPGLGAFYLIGFEQVRSDGGKTYMRGSEAWEKNVYRHPDRQGAFPVEKYNMGHDIYSLGVCLLEIGLWKSFLSYGSTQIVQAPGEGLGLSMADVRSRTPDKIKMHLTSLAKAQLPLLAGQIYTDVVVNCLTCLDEDDNDYGEIDDGEVDEDGVLAGVKFIEKVLLKLNEISV